MEKHEIRYNYCHLIAKVWFELLDKLYDENNDLKENGINSEFHKHLSDCTLLGELIGIEGYSQIVNYPEQCILFTSLINNTNVNETCMLPEIFTRFCQKWGLRQIALHRVGFFYEKSTLKEGILDLYHRVTCGSL